MTALLTARAATTPVTARAVTLVVPGTPEGAVKAWRRLVTGIDPAARPGAWQVTGPWLRPAGAYQLPDGAVVLLCDQYDDRREVTMATTAPGELLPVKTWTLKGPIGKRVTAFIARRLPAGSDRWRSLLLDEVPNRRPGRCPDCRRWVAPGAGRIVADTTSGRHQVAHPRGACPPPPQVIAPNRRGEPCYLCADWVEPGTGVAVRLAEKDPVTRSWYRAAHQTVPGGCPPGALPGPVNRSPGWCADCGELVRPGSGYWSPDEENLLRHARACPVPSVAGPTWIVRRPRHEPRYQTGQVRRVRVDLRSGPAVIWPEDQLVPFTIRRPDQPPLPASAPGLRVLGASYVEMVGVVIETIGGSHGGQRARVRAATTGEAADLLAEDTTDALEARPDGGAFPARWTAEKMGDSCPWVAEITGRCPDYGYRREFLAPDRDHRRANARGTRGVRFGFTLLPGRVYEAREPLTRHRHQRLFLRATPAGDVIEIAREEVEAWLNHAPVWAAS